MLLLLISYLILNSFTSASEQELINKHRDENTLGGYVSSLNNPPSQNNNTYIDKAENMLLVPIINKFYDEHKNKKKSLKKSPKRTIQKIIKKNRVKTRRMYVNQITVQPTQPPNVEYDNMNAQEELALWKDDSATTQSSNQKRKPRKWNPKMARYSMPFQKHTNRRYKRSDDREDVFIIKDLDEVEFLNKDNDYNVVKAHFKKYW